MTHANPITNPAFFGAGNATFTVSNGTTHYTYKIRQPRGKRVHFVSLLTGPNNEADYTYLGIYYPPLHDVRLTAKSAFATDSMPVKVLRWALHMVATGKELPIGYAIQHEGACGRCGRVLTQPESIETGFGPECAGKVRLAAA